MDNKDTIALLNKYNEGQCTEQEKAWVETWYLDQPAGLINDAVEDLSKDLDEVELKLIEHITVRRLRVWPRVAAAAAITLFLSVGGYFVLHKQASPQVAHNQIYNDIAPGGNKAILTLSNGRQLSLTDAKTGALSKEGGQTISKTNEGTITYQGNGPSGNGNQQVTYNTISTPRGGQWSVILPDGTKVMLDAASSIKYPVSFNNIREVEITGQVYFEVVHNAAKAFRVITKDQVIEDIGTKFNVNAYGDEPAIKTTLFEGAVKVSNPGAATPFERNGVKLDPGQQAVFKNNKLTIAAADTEEALAWKKGYFIFHDEKIESIMRKLTRWYDIEVEYGDNLPPVIFDGEIPRNTDLSQVLKVLEAANVHFTLMGKKLTVKS